jgi:hypothetical protein
MQLGAKKRAALVADVVDKLDTVSADMHRPLIAAIVDLLLSRQEAQVAPLLKAAKGALGNLSTTWGFAVALRNAIAAYEAAQADQPEPRYRSRDMGGWWVVEDTTKPMLNGVLPVVCMVMHPASEAQANAVCDDLNARERAR